MDAPWVTTPAAAPALAFAAAGGDPLALSGALGSRFGLDAAQRAAVLTQIELRARAASRWGVAAEGLWFTRDGLEQASRPGLRAGHQSRRSRRAP